MIFNLHNRNLRSNSWFLYSRIDAGKRGKFMACSLEESELGNGLSGRGRIH